MIETLDQLDKALFLFVNMTLANPVTDWFMPIMTGDNFLRIGWLLCMIAMLIWGDKRLRWLVLASVVVLALTNHLSAEMLKKWIERPRPCHIMDNINLLVGCGGGYAMPSAHAANSWGQAILFGLVTPRVRWPLAIIAFLVTISRVFVGVHYPFDVTAGALLGAAVGLAVAYWSGRVLGGPPAHGVPLWERSKKNSEKKEA